MANKNIFIDCGTHCFQGFKDFANRYNIDSNWDCYCFEANPFTYNESKKYYNELISSGYNISHYNRAVSNKVGKIKVNCSLEWDKDPNDKESYFNQGSNILDNPPNWEQCVNRNYDYISNDVFVDCEDFSSFILNNCSLDDYVLIKMDIEGSEFDVLSSLIETNAYKLINEIYCEWHHRFFDNQREYHKLSENIKRTFLENNILLYDWI